MPLLVVSECCRFFCGRSACFPFETCRKDRVQVSDTLFNCGEKIAVFADEKGELDVERERIQVWLLEERFEVVEHIPSPLVGVAMCCELVLVNELVPADRSCVVVEGELLKLSDVVANSRADEG